jgi:hypothetical protein
MMLLARLVKRQARTPLPIECVHLRRGDQWPGPVAGGLRFVTWDEDYDGDLPPEARDPRGTQPARAAGMTR